MNEDIRLSTTFFSHRKTKKLQRLLGDHGVVCLMRLWTRVAVEKPSGVLIGWDEDDIEIEADFKGDIGAFAKALTDVGFLDHGENYSLHNWEGRQAWVVNAQDRSDRARMLRMAKTHKKIYKKLVNDGCTGVTRGEYNKLTKVQRTVNDTLTTPLTPAPAPAPAPDPVPAPKATTTVSGKSTRRSPQPPFSEIISHLNEKAGSSFRPTSKATKDFISARFSEGFTAEDFKMVIDHKCEEWRGDEKMDRFLRPQTLFCRKNFEGYLVEARKGQSTLYGRFGKCQMPEQQ